MGKYKDYDMSTLNITLVRDYSLYLALKSSGQGIGEEVRGTILQIESVKEYDLLTVGCFCYSYKIINYFITIILTNWRVDVYGVYMIVSDL